jgi:outer membrane protein OmpA-like peptidoglycan-associated protein
MLLRKKLNFFRNIHLCGYLSLLMMANCGFPSVKEDNKVEQLLSNFQEREMGRLLSVKYLMFADVLQRNDERKNSEYFHNMSQKALKGDYGYDFKSFLTMVPKGRPEQLADLHFLFNCWRYFEINGESLGEATICKNSFLNLSRILERDVRRDTTKTELMGKEMGLAAEEMEVLENLLEEKSFDIHFDYDSYKLNPTALSKIGVLLRYLAGLENDYRLIIIGHTDRAGKTLYNKTMARRRANTVLNVLCKNGVPQNLIEAQAAGSVSPRIITKKDTKNQLNRRVEIIIDTPYKKQDFLPKPL